jgi:histidine triad (HIT) family protein
MGSKNCIFCGIINEEIPTEFVHKEDDVFVFRDINPKAPVHLLVVPREHIESFLDLGNKHFTMLTKIIKVIQKLVKEQKLSKGYRVVINGGRHQEVAHLHFHLLAD